MEKQYIYILSNPLYCGLLKIGRTIEEPVIRAKLLSKYEGVPENFQLEWHMIVPNSKMAEKIAHDILENVRPNPKKEFFKISVFEASEIIKEKLIEYFKIKEPEIKESDKFKKEKKY